MDLVFFDSGLFDLLWPGCLAFLGCVTLLLALRPVARAVRLVDRPGGHKRHEGSVPVIGGIAIYGAVLMAALSDVVLGQHGVMLLITGAMLVGLGVVDDRFDLPANVRLMGQLTAALLLTYGTGFKVDDLGNLFGFGTIALGRFDVAFTVVGCMALINAFNMLDGLDGLAGGVAIVGFIGLSVLAAVHGAQNVLHISLCMIGALAAFLLFNLPTAFNRSVRTFMGDAGSTLLGFVLAGASLSLVQTKLQDISPMCLVWMLPIPVFELFSSTARRLLNGKSPFAADRGHFHHRLMEAGFFVRGIFIGYFALSTISVAIGVAGCLAAVPDSFMLAVFALLFVAWKVFVRLSPRFLPKLPPRWQRHTENWT